MPPNISYYYKTLTITNIIINIFWLTRQLEKVG